MNRSQIIEMQKRIGTTPDGFWGPKSILACQNHLRNLMPVPNPWPSTDQASLTVMFGKAGDESRLVNANVEGLGVKYDGKEVKTIRCNSTIRHSLLRIIFKLTQSESGRLALSQYAGCYNNRPMCGGSLPSLHARGAAIDLMPAANGNRTSWPVSSTMPLEVMEVFAEEGWLAAGAFWGRDGMHFQATR
jgi:hypothetical protein